MTHNLKTFVMNTLIVGALMTPASALAKDYWHWHDNRWDHRADLRSDIPQFEILRALPLTGRQVVLGELAA